MAKMKPLNRSQAKDLERLLEQRKSLQVRLKSATENFLAARARRNHLSAMLEACEDRIEVIQQGQLDLFAAGGE